ncbi:MAG: endolytic transglycosylase MltG [Clostridia bacterium]|nr:endolytic transglycosylase MltG [Clostridia bacterium]
MGENKRKNFPLKITAGILLIILIIFAVVMVFDVNGIGGGDTPIDMMVTDGATLRSIARDLKATGIIQSNLIFRLYARTTGNGIYQMGMHSFTPSMKYKDIIAELEKMPETDTYTVTIPEGFEIWKIADELEKAGIINREVFMREIETGNFDYPFVAAIPARENRLEGYLFPDTYTFSGKESEHSIINTMLDNFNKNVVPVYEQSGTTQSLDEIVKLASVIEREAAGDADRALVASVFVNRINKGMKLESCATVQYILHERKTILSNEDTLIDSPYNTYLYGGLPVGPIAAPGLKSIEAALHPAESNYMYFLANAEGTESYFSETYEEHTEKQKQIQGQ